MFPNITMGLSKADNDISASAESSQRVLLATALGMAVGIVQVDIALFLLPFCHQTFP